MSELAMLLPARRRELLIRPLGEQGQHVVKDPRTGKFFHLGEAEHFLLTQLDGQSEADGVCAAYASRFGETLSEEDLRDFVALAEAQGLLQPAGGEHRCSDGAAEDAMDLGHPADDCRSTRPSILYWRRNLFDPDRLFIWLEPRIQFFWTRTFLLLSACCIALAVIVAWADRLQLARSFVQALRWDTVALVWLTLLVVTLGHECAHGLTCKHYGGDVHEIGFLLLFFMPCFYCNVSDAWLFKEKSKRLWVSFAGGYFELSVWAVAVFVWRLTVTESLPHRVAFIVVAACGIQTLLNFNPLLKLDGYYLLSDWLEAPNLHQRAQGHFKGHLRSLLWGAAKPAPETRAKLLWRFGLASWLYSVVFLGLMLWGMFYFLGTRWGLLGLVVVALLGLVGLRSILEGICAGETSKMVLLRHKRTLMWLLILCGVIGVLLLPREDRASGACHVRPAVRAEVRAPVAGFLRELRVNEGDRVSSSAVVARLEVPDLDSRIAQKRAEIQEAHARLRLLEVGPRPEEVAEQRYRVERARAWRDRAQDDLARTRKALEAELTGLEKQVAQYRAELAAAKDALDRTRLLVSQRAMAQGQYGEAQSKWQVCQARVEQAQAQTNACQAKGALEAEGELARREKELAEAQSTLKLLAAGSRPDEVAAQRACLSRLQHEAQYLEAVQGKLAVFSPVPGLVMTPRLQEKVGQYVREGELICIVEEPSTLEVEIALVEEDVARVQPGQEVGLRFRILALETISATVDRIAPAAARTDGQCSVIVYCQLADTPAELRPGMSGYARVYTGQRPIGGILLERILRFVRTEFWW